MPELPPDDADPDREDSTGFDPFEGLFREDGGLDTDVVARRLPGLVELLRRHEPCFALRIDFDTLGKSVLSTAGAALRDAGDDEEFDAALRDFSIHHLHELIADGAAESAGVILQALANDASAARKRRRSAAAGVALVSGLPDDRGLRGRGLFDLLLRISMEELHAQQNLRTRADADGGLSAEALKTFWGTYPALRHHYETRYREDVQAVLEAIDGDVLPQVVSVDLAVRGAHALLLEVAEETAKGGAVDAGRAGAILQGTYEDDMLDDGRALILARWQAAAVQARDLAGETEKGSDEDVQRRKLIEICEKAVRIAAPGSPGGELIVFHAYMQAVVEGSFHVRDPQEAEAAREAFGDDGLRVEGVLGYAKHLAARGDPDDSLRVLVGAIELWPEHDGLRELAVAVGATRDAVEREVRQGPRYAEIGETHAEDVGEQDAAAAPGDPFSDDAED